MSVDRRGGRTRPAAPRTQEQRRAETQARLLAATVACLAELGWSGTEESAPCPTR